MIETHSIIITVLVGLLGIAGGFLGSNLTMGRAVSRLAERIGSLETALELDQKRTDDRFVGLTNDKNRILVDADREHERIEGAILKLEQEVRTCQSRCGRRAEDYTRASCSVQHLSDQIESLEKRVAMEIAAIRTDIQGVRAELKNGRAHA